MENRILLSVLTGVLLAGSVPSCTNLDEVIYDQLLAEDFGNTETEINALVGTVYNTLKTYWPGNFQYLSECGGSMAVVPTRYGGDWYDGGQYRELFMHAYTAETSVILSCWSAATTAIGTCNATINTIENSTVLEDSLKEQKVAEVRGVRAFWYYVMMDNWGNVPLVTVYEENVSELPACTARQEIFDWLVAELTEITTSCPDASSSNYGKFTKGTAYTLLAKLYLNAEAWDVTVEEGSAYELASDCCDQVMSMSFYSLETAWSDNFIADNSSSTEAILATTFSDQDTDDENYFMKMTLHYKDNLSLGGSFSAWNGICAQPDYVRLFDAEDPRYEGSFLIGQQYNLSTGEAIFTDLGDSLNHTVEVTIIAGTERDGTTWGDVAQPDGARGFKWEYEDDLVDAMENDFHIFRLADVYLMKAEALLRAGGSVSEATSLVNRIRERAYGSSDQNYTTVDLDKILLERRLEFAWEGWSRQDDIRFGEFESMLWSSSNCERETDTYLRLYPIPQDAWQTNQNLVQNTGYSSF